MPRISNLGAAIGGWVVVTLLVAAGTARAQDQSLRGLSGEWHLASRSAEDDIDASIARVTGQMNVFVREMARSRIDEAVDPEQRVALDVEENAVVVQVGSWGPVRLSLDGRYVRRGDAGHEIRARALVSRGQLTIEQVTSEGTRVLYFQPDGDRLRMSVRIRSERLPEDIVHRLPYRRTADAPRLASR